MREGAMSYSKHLVHRKYIEMDEFSFPKLAQDQQAPLHRLPFTNFRFTPQEEKKPPHYRRRSFSLDERSGKVSEALTRNLVMHSPALSDRHIDYEERMDMLWEDFNEELHRMSRDQREAAMEEKTGGVASSETAEDARGSEDYVEPFNEVKFCWAPALRPSTKGRMLDRRKPSLLVMMKMLKKLFLIQKIRSSKKIEGNHRAKYKFFT